MNFVDHNPYNIQDWLKLNPVRYNLFLQITITVSRSHLL